MPESSEKFIKTVKGESVIQRKERLFKFLTKEKLEILCDKKLPVRKMAQELGVSDDAINEALKKYNLETKCKKNTKHHDDEDRLELIDIDLDRLPPPFVSSKIIDKADKLSESISNEDLIILGILAYCRPGKKVFEKSVALLKTDFSKKVAENIGKINQTCSDEHIKNANTIAEIATKIRLINAERVS